MIVWLENPRPWRYLRESTRIRGTRRGFKRCAKLALANFYKLIGYELVCRLERGMFLYRIYWLKTYDSDCPEGHKVYDRLGGQPCEARDVSDLLARCCLNRERCEEYYGHNFKCPSNCQLHQNFEEA